MATRSRFGAEGGGGSSGGGDYRGDVDDSDISSGSRDGDASQR